MRNLKKLLAVIVAICLVATLSVPAFAADAPAYGTQATTLNTLGLYDGISATSFDPDLATAVDRQTAIALLVKMLGKKADASAMAAADQDAALANFTDAKDLAGWAKPFMAYAVKNGMVKGTSDTTLAPKDAVTGDMFATFILRNLGYTVDDVNTGLATLQTKGGLTADQAKAFVKSLVKDDIVGIAYGALQAANKDGKKLIDVLVDAKVVDAAKAETAGVYSPKTTATAAAAGAKIFKVTFSKAVDTAKATFAVKKGSVTMAVSKVEWDTAKAVATITMVSKLSAGDYVITVGGLDLATTAYTVTAADEKVAKIEISSDVAPKVAGTLTDVTFGYVVKNQYDEDVTGNYTLTWTPSSGTFQADPSTGVKKLRFGAEQAKDTAFVVTAIEPNSGVYATKTIKVGDPAKVAKINVLGLYNADGKTLDTSSDFTTFAVKVEGFDQYGNKVTKDALNDATQTTVVVSNTTVVSKGVFDVVDDTTALKLVKPASNVDGTAVINFISNITGQSASITITVAKAAALDKLTLSAPADIAVKGETVLVPFTAQDQYGTELAETAKGALTSSDVTLTCTDPNVGLGFSYNYETKKAELAMDLTDAAVTTGSKVIMAVTKTGKVSQITVDVKATATPVTVSAVKDLAKKMTVGGTSSIGVDNVVVIDQYGREMTLDATWFASYKLTVASATPANVTAGAAEITTAAGISVMTGVAAGTSTISISIEKADDTAIADSTFEFTAETVAKSAIASYAVDAPATLFNDAAHDKDFAVYGKTSSGEKVALAAADYVATSNLAGITFPAGAISARGVVLTNADDNKTAAILVIIDGANGPESVTKSVVVSAKTPVLTTISADATVYMTVAEVTNANIKAKFTGKDQYDVDITPTITNVLYTNISGDGITTTGNGTAAAAINNVEAGDSFQVTIVTDNGLTKSTNVVVKP